MLLQGLCDILRSDHLMEGVHRPHEIVPNRHRKRLPNVIKPISQSTSETWKGVNAIKERRSRIPT